MIMSSGSGSGETLPTLITCSPPTTSIDVFSLASEIITCMSVPDTATLLYIFTFAGQTIVFSDSQLSSRLAVEMFGAGGAEVAITVCEEGERRSCSQDSIAVDVGVVTLSVELSLTGGFPYGQDLIGDSSFRGVLDGARPIYPPDSVPFYSNYYNTLYVSETRANTSYVAQNGLKLSLFSAPREEGNTLSLEGAQRVSLWNTYIQPLSGHLEVNI